MHIINIQLTVEVYRILLYINNDIENAVYIII